MEKPLQVELIIKRASIQAPLRWFKESWQLFSKAPSLWIIMFLVIMALTLIGQLHTLFGIVVFLLSPFLTAGVYKSAAAMNQGEKVTFDWLFKPLQEAGCRAVLLRIAAANIMAQLPVGWLFMELRAQHEIGALQPGMVLLFVILVCLVSMLFAYAVAIAYFLKIKQLLPVLVASFTACWRNIQPLIVFVVLAIGLFLLTVPTLMIGLIVVMPLLHLAFFMSFCELFAVQIKPSNDSVLEV